jgi:hypothetical protein
MAARALGCFDREQIVEMLDRIQNAELTEPAFAVTRTSVL